jgi:CRISPR-associated protein Cmr6
MTRLEGRRIALASVAPAPSTHAGLWLDKFLRVLSPETEQDKNAIRDLLVDACRTAVPEGYARAFERRRQMLQALDGGVEGGITRVWEAEAQGRLIVALGTQALRETNIALLHTWGVPCIPGSALKGLASATAHRHGRAPAWNKAGEAKLEQGADHKVLFGDTTSAGYVVFHDAWWIPEGATTLPLELDVMTVHHAEYYGGGNAAPADWDEPTPVGFLTAQGTYLVALSGPEEWVMRAGEWLKLGLEREGIGAKTQAGYGRMTLARKPSDQERDLEQRIARLRKLPARHQGAPTAAQHMQALREAWPEPSLRPVVLEVGKALAQADPGFWRKWAVDTRRTGEERAFLEEIQMIPPSPPPAPSPAATAAPAPPSVEEWVEAAAWVVRDKQGRAEVVIEPQGKSPLRRKIKDVVIDGDGLREALEGATVAARIKVAARLEKGKLCGMRWP